MFALLKTGHFYFGITVLAVGLAKETCSVKQSDLFLTVFFLWAWNDANAAEPGAGPFDFCLHGGRRRAALCRSCTFSKPRRRLLGF